MNSRPKQAVIFDMDGVLVDSEPVHFASTQLLLARYGLPFTEKDNREFLGSTDRRMFEVLTQRHQLSTPILELIAERKEIYMGLIENGGLPWREGILTLIPELAQRVVHMGVASSGLRRIIEHTLERGGIRHHFGAVVSADDIPAPKPDPAIYLEAARRLGVPPQQCWAIEDTDVGVRAAKNAGMTVIAFPTETTALMDLSVADHRAGTTDDIRRFLWNGS
jgi:HAD superfamily hydrolase (TIGR01509 family)